jgi:UDP-glucose 4-epimerase
LSVLRPSQGIGRPGDIAACYADSSLAESLLRWKAHRIHVLPVWRWLIMDK